MSTLCLQMRLTAASFAVSAARNRRESSRRMHFYFRPGRVHRHRPEDHEARARTDGNDVSKKNENTVWNSPLADEWCVPLLSGKEPIRFDFGV